MCGIFGMNNLEGGSYSDYSIGINRLFRLSESRGKEAAGVCLVNESKITICKGSLQATKFIKRSEYRNSLKAQFELAKEYRFAMGHARMITNGSLDNSNNQPVIYNDLVAIHNGIIVNDDEVWKKYIDIKRYAEVDTEVLLGLIEHFYKGNLINAFMKSMEEIEGSVSIALLSKHTDDLLLYTNIGSLYVLTNQSKTRLVFASERYILEKFIEAEKKASAFDVPSIFKINPDSGMLINLKTNDIRYFDKSNHFGNHVEGGKEKEIEYIQMNSIKQVSDSINLNVKYSELKKLMGVNESNIRNLRRCTKCLLPETFPGITFDDKGVCSMCNTYLPQKKQKY